MQYIFPNSEKRKTRQTDTIARFALWILRDNAQEITTVLANRPAEVLVED